MPTFIEHRHRQCGVRSCHVNTQNKNADQFHAGACVLQNSPGMPQELAAAVDASVAAAHPLLPAAASASGVAAAVAGARAAAVRCQRQRAASADAPCCRRVAAAAAQESRGRGNDYRS